MAVLARDKVSQKIDCLDSNSSGYELCIKLLGVLTL